MERKLLPLNQAQRIKESPETLKRYKHIYYNMDSHKRGAAGFWSYITELLLGGVFYISRLINFCKHAHRRKVPLYFKGNWQ